MGNIWTSPSSALVDEDNTISNTDPSPRNDQLIALCDYPSADVSAPLFRTGERLILLADEGYRLRVRSIQTGSENYIPKLYVAKVYHGWLFEGVARAKAEELLCLPRNRVGSFMIRESQRGVYSLSVRHRAVVHYRIFRLPNNWYYITPGLTFQCLEDLVNHYSDSEDGLCCLLTTPCQAVTNGNRNLASQAPPVVMRNTFNWNNVISSELMDQRNLNPGNKDSGMSFGLRQSLLSYMSLAGSEDGKNSSSCAKKTRSSVCVPVRHGLGPRIPEEEQDEWEYTQPSS